MHQPTGAAYDVVLLAHAGCAVVGLVTTVAATATAGRLERTVSSSSAGLPEALRRYFRPGFNWAGRAVYGIPVFGFPLVAMSNGAFALGDAWVAAGLVLFAAVVLVGEGLLWPAERRLQRALAPPERGDRPPPGTAGVRTDARTMARAGAVVLVLLLAGVVLMVAQP